MNIAAHLERHLGAIARGWASDSLPGVQVVLFRDWPFPGAVTLGTLGLSNTKLEMPRGRYVRQELLFASWGDAPLDELASLLFGAAELCLDSERAFLRGEVIQLPQGGLPNSPLTSLYAALPVVYPEGLAICSGSVPPTVVVWLLALHASEAAFVARRGWSAFEDRLERDNPDLLDLRRASVA